VAVLDPEHNAVVIRIVYDGPPHAGKTTSVRSLARSLVRDVNTPLEAAGRTVFFDWMEYTGGLFEGHQIRCQIVSVPGQPELAARRRALLETADVVVFVADTSDRVSVDRSVEHVRQMVEILRGCADPPVGLVVQANKRDLPGAVPRDEITAALGDDFARTAVTESIAERGVGIRETFVLAVRLALDRIRELMARGQLPSGKPAVDSAEQLLAMLEDLPVPAPDPAPADDIASALQAIVSPPRPRLPDARVPSGAIWPPVEGRLVLHEAAMSGLVLHRVGAADWIAGMGTGWRVHSSGDATFDQFDDGRQALLVWARIHAAYAALLSPSRCVVLADAGRNTWRLWQLVKLVPSLRAWIVDGAELDARALLGRLASAAMLLGEAHARCAETRLPATLDSIGGGPNGPLFVALMPAASAGPAPRPPDVAERIIRELARMLASELVERRPELARLVAAGPARRTPWDDLVATALA
jgi:signal recognition particle receptor subunit beta